jgi:uncharacterized OB-fold protein
MTTKPRVPALGAEGWFTDEGGPALLGNRCTTCGTAFFPKAAFTCRNPACDGTEFAEARLAGTGTVWSYTDARYQPPAPYVAAADPYEPFVLAAVELDADGLVVLGQMTTGTTVADLHVGARVELAIETLFADDEHEYLIWKWKVAGDGR